MRRTILELILTAGLSAVAAVSTAQAPADARGPSTPAADPCNPVHIAACGLPFPSDTFTRPDPSSPTGRRVDVDDAIVGEAYRAAVPESALPSAVLDGSTGFSASGPVLFELDTAPDPQTLPSDGGDAVVAFDVESGARVPIRAEVDPDAARAAYPAAVVRVWPATRFPHGHRIVAALTKSVKKLDGTSYTPAPRFADAVDGGRGPVARRYEQIADFLAERGIAAEDLLSATDFTIRAEADAQRDMMRAVSTASAQRHPVRIDKVTGADAPEGAVTVYGRVRLTNFQANDGTFDAAGPGRPYWTTFHLLVPASAASEPAPVAIFGHGYAGNKTRMIEMSVQNAMHGIATLAIDWSYRGVRVLADRDYVLMLRQPADQAEFVGMFLQGVVDVASLRAAVASELADLDVLAADAAGAVTAAGGDGRPDLRGERVTYQGTSYGGMLGAAVLGVVPGLDGGILHVCGIGLIDTFAHLPGWFWRLVGGVMPRNGAGADRSLGIALVQHAVDAADGANYAHRYDDPLDGGPPRSVLLQYGEDDAFVRNVSSEALVAVAGLAEVSYAVDGSIEFEAGSGWQMVTNPGNIPEPLWPFAAHSLTAALSAGREVADAWLAEYLTAHGL